MNALVMHTADEVKDMILRKQVLMLAAAEPILMSLPSGEWIGGTIPYFMGDVGGCFDEQHILVTEMPAAEGVSIKMYDGASLPSIALDAPENGCSFVIIPSGSAIHRQYAQEASGYDDMFMKPIAGWISGTSLSELGAVTPKVVDGRTGTMAENGAVVMHVALPDNVTAQVDIVNIFTQDDSDVLSFPKGGFEVTDCLVNGKSAQFAAYVKEHGIDTRLPLVANLNGAMINTSFQSVDEQQGVVRFYAPVFSEYEYRLARPVTDYAAAFAKAVPQQAGDAVFACNCILNYLYGELEGKQTGLRGPITFGEIAYQLVNQTLVYVTLHSRA